MRWREEFYCSTMGGGCGWYFLTYLRESMIGNFIIECPNCYHLHFRFISNGLITEDKHHDTYGEAITLVGLGSTLRDTPWHDDPIYRRSQLQQVNMQ